VTNILRFRWFALLMSAAVIALAIAPAFARGGKNTSPQTAQLVHPYDELAVVPQKARARHNPLEGNADAAAAGRKLFQQHCAECHGDHAEGGTGGKKGPSLRAEEVRSATPGTLFWILTNGVVRRGMPVWSKLPEPERWQIVVFLRTLPPVEQAR